MREFTIGELIECAEREAVMRRRDVLPISLPPRGLSREVAAAYFGVSAGTFNEMVRDGRVPQPKVINSRLVWDRVALDLAFDALPDKQAPVLEFAV